MSLKQPAGYTVLSAPASAAAGVTPTELIPGSTSAFHRTLRSRDACTVGKGWKPPKHPAFACELTQMTKRCQTNVTEESDRKLDTRYTAHTWSLRIHNHYRTKTCRFSSPSVKWWYVHPHVDLLLSFLTVLATGPRA